MKMLKTLSCVTSLGGKLVNFFSKTVDFADHLIHHKEYVRREKARKRFWTVFWAVVGGLTAVLLFPYRICFKKNGDFEICTLLLHVYRKTDNEGSGDGYQLADIPEDPEEDELVEAPAEASDEA